MRVPLSRAPEARLRAQTRSSGGVVINIRLTLWITVKINVDVRSPSTAEARSTTRGPSWRPPNCSGPRRSRSHEGPSVASPGSSAGLRKGKAAGGSTAGNNIDNRPTTSAKAVSRRTERHHSDRARPLPRVITTRATTKPTRHSGPARIGVSRKTRDQASFSRGSKRRSQPLEPSTYWPIGTWRNQSMTQPLRLC